MKRKKIDSFFCRFRFLDEIRTTLFGARCDPVRFFSAFWDLSGAARPCPGLRRGDGEGQGVG
ncbi:MAG: hypothetical protein C6W56_14290 [Caldibacillus debilis]|nr:MAG: hypothetical protein C6W56_14290 [Caldibacillus debilis]